ncbi:MAG: hypothetical protein ACI87A_001695 [Planctomycetota bacterium]
MHPWLPRFRVSSAAARLNLIQVHIRIRLANDDWANLVALVDRIREEARALHAFRSK